ncbi:MAG: octanoyltransferase LipM [Candidatus Sericytochromatia bacterium]|nr:MAG: octanoyltransferase LipM [Candidatus Sericytochromatia bacterium]
MSKWILLELSEYSLSNMDIDLILLDKYINNLQVPILRFYSWKKKTISLGRNQDINDINIDFCRKNNIRILKRPTGGKAVFHQGDFTYSLVASKKDGFSTNIHESYLKISKAIIYSLKLAFPNLNLQIGEENTRNYSKEAFCFESSTISDININGKKIVGSAQFRKGDYFLQHGSIILNQDFELLKGIFSNNLKFKLTSFYLNLGYIPDYETIKNCIIKGFREYFNIEFTYKSFNEI